MSHALYHNKRCVYNEAMNQPLISLVAAHAHKRVIATNHGIPWKLAADSAHWRGLIVGHAIIVGDTTYREQGTMADSTNIVIGHNITEAIPKGFAAASVEEALKIAGQHENKEVFVVGGASIFAQTITGADKLYLTLVDLDIADGSRFFPEYENDFHMISATPQNQDGLKFSFTLWERNR